MALDLGLVAIGLALLVAGGEFLVRGAAALSARLGVPPLVIGLTVVAFGTSAPELVVSVAAVLGGNPDVAFGNVFGSNLANIGLILGACILITPLTVEISLVRREIPLLVLVSLLVAVPTLGQGLGRGTGALLLVTFAGVLAYTLRSALRSRAQVVVPDAAGAGRSLSRLGGQILLGLVALGFGSRVTVEASVSLARAVGVSEAVIGLTLVAVATSLPELVTSLVATLRGQADLAVGNVVGSNLFNLLFILGSSALIAPLPVPQGGRLDAWAAAAIACLLLPMAVSHRFRLVRWEGGLLLACYLGFMVWRVL